MGPPSVPALLVFCQSYSLNQNQGVLVGESPRGHVEMLGSLPGVSVWKAMAALLGCPSRKGRGRTEPGGKGEKTAFADRAALAHILSYAGSRGLGRKLRCGAMPPPHFHCRGVNGERC